jgi:hypothetical protein
MDATKQEKAVIIDSKSAVICLNADCANNINSACNLKWVGVDTAGKCAGIVKVRMKKKENKK